MNHTATGTAVTLTDATVNRPTTQGAPASGSHRSSGRSVELGTGVVVLSDATAPARPPCSG